MFHLLVKGSGWKNNNNLWGSRSLTVNEFTSEELVQQFRPHGKFDIAQIARYPAVFMSEADSVDSDLARIGRITNVVTSSRDEITLAWSWDQTLPSVPVNVLQSLAPELGISKMQLFRTHWAAHHADLFEILLRHGVGSSPKPDVFAIDALQHPETTQISVMMPFAGNFTPVYNALSKMAEGMGLRCNRADDIWEHNAIIQDVVSLICKSSVVICDLSGKNSNVFYEAGIAHCLGKK